MGDLPCVSVEAPDASGEVQVGLLQCEMSRQDALEGSSQLNALGSDRPVWGLRSLPRAAQQSCQGAGKCESPQGPWHSALRACRCTSSLRP